LGKLQDKIALIPGGAGFVGEHIVSAFLHEGATVLVPSRRPDALKALHQSLAPDLRDRMIPLLGDLSDEAGAERLRAEALRRVSRIDTVVASLGGTWRGNLPIRQVPADVWHDYWKSNVFAHIVTAKTFLPVLARGASYTILGGLSAKAPIPRYAPVGITSAALMMLVRDLVLEEEGSGVRINEVLINAVVRTRDNAGYEGPMGMEPETVSAYLVWLASDEAADVHGRILNLDPTRP
jgi:3-oxoacyl-[acyl-carrier protein] reductase